jgi:hypothetical protein
MTSKNRQFWGQQDASLVESIGRSKTEEEERNIIGVKR